MIKRIFNVLSILTLTSCSFAPPYERPPMPIPEHFKDIGTWVKVKSKPKVVKPDAWWHAFQDPILNDLEEKLTVANQDLRVAYAHYQEAFALAQVARASFFPSIQALFNH